MCRLDYGEDERIDSMNITVYLGANEGNDYRLGEAVRELGDWIGTSGHVLVYGGSKSGLMGELAESVIEAGGEATGVRPEFFIDAAVQYEKLTELIVTKNMEERKAKMIELGDAFIAFPGRNRDIRRDCGSDVQGVFEASGGALHFVQSERLL